MRFRRSADDIRERTNNCGKFIAEPGVITWTDDLPEPL